MIRLSNPGPRTEPLDAQYALGQAHEADSNRSAALKAYYRCLALSPGHRQAIERIRRLETEDVNGAGLFPDRTREVIPNQMCFNRLKDPEFPHTKRARIFTGTRCNIRCRFCYYIKNRDYWGADLVERQLRLAREDGIECVDFSGGESSVEKSWFSYLAVAKTLGFKQICIVTNGLKFADRDFVRRSRDAGLNEILFSLHGYDDANHDWLTEHKGAYAKLLEGIENAIDMGFAVRFNTTVYKQNMKHLLKVVDRIRQYRPLQTNFILFNYWGTAGTTENEMAVSYSEAAPYVKEAIDAIGDAVPYINVRYIPFCFMQGYEKHVCDYPQKKFDPFEWSQRALTFYDRKFLTAPLLFHRQLENYYQRYVANVPVPWNAMEKRDADNLCVAVNRSGYAKMQGCANCRYYLVCDGLEAQYAQSRGTDELTPVPGRWLTNPLHFRMHFYDHHEDRLSPHLSEPVRHSGPVHEKAVSVIVPTHNRSDVIETCLRALEVQTLDREKFEVIVVDDGSTDETAGILASLGSDVGYDLSVLKLPQSGPSKARNEGVKTARGEICLIINDDAIADPEMVERHLAHHRQFGNNDRIAVVGSRLTHPDHAENVMNTIFDQLPLGIPLDRTKCGYYGPNYFITFNLSAQRTAFEKYGYFDEEFKSALAEDTELGIRWANHGCKFWFSDQPRAYHLHPLPVESWKQRIVRQMKNSRIMYRKHPGFKPKNPFWEQTDRQLQAAIDKFGPTADAFENALRAIEEKTVGQVVGATLMGDPIRNEQGFVAWVRKFSVIFSTVISARAILAERAAGDRRQIKDCTSERLAVGG